MPSFSVEEVARGWISVQESWWAYMQLQHSIESEPERGWKIILAILPLIQSAELLEDLGAGPLEDLMAHHGPSFIDRVEHLAKQDATFRSALAKVGGGLRIEPKILDRIQRAAAREDA